MEQKIKFNRLSGQIIGLDRLMLKLIDLFIHHLNHTNTILSICSIWYNFKSCSFFNTISQQIYCRFFIYKIFMFLFANSFIGKFYSYL